MLQLTNNVNFTLKNGLEKEVEDKIDAIYKAKGVARPNTKAIYLKVMMVRVNVIRCYRRSSVTKDVYDKIKVQTLSQVRGTVQADILKEDQAQNTCIFSTEFSIESNGRCSTIFY
jgi:methylmalonyl-CoA mutase